MPQLRGLLGSRRSNVFFFQRFDQERAYIVQIGIDLCLSFTTVNVEKEIAE